MMQHSRGHERAIWRLILDKRCRGVAEHMEAEFLAATLTERLGNGEGKRFAAQG
jgi:hypothetical protein